MKKERVLIIAEAGVNHNGSLDMAYKLVDEAAAAGADIVKFQTFRADKLASKNAPKAEYQIANDGAAESQYEMLKRLELSEEYHHKLIAHCRKAGIEFLSTPFDIESLQMLVKTFDLQRVKLGSGELTNAPLLLAAAQTGKPVILSTGMGTLDEVREALGVLAFGYAGSSEKPSRAAFKAAYLAPGAKAVLAEKVILLHCTTEYPTPDQDVNLSAMKTMAAEFGLRQGYSDHTTGIAISIAATALGACVIEKHFTLDCNLPGPDHKASLEPVQLKAMVEGIRSVEKAMGDGVKAAAPSEVKNIAIARKSLVAARDLAQGAVLTGADIAIKRPGSGRSPYDYWDLPGQSVSKPLKQDDPF